MKQKPIKNDSILYWCIFEDFIGNIIFFFLECYAVNYLKKLYYQPERITTINMSILTLIRVDIFTVTKCTKRLLRVGQMPVMLFVCKY